MKRFVFAFGAALVLLVSCEEVPPYIDFTKPKPITYVPRDTTYISGSVAPAQHKAVLIEDVTGVRCNNCPQAAQKAKDIVTAKTEDSVVVVALYSTPVYNNNFTTPWPGFPALGTVYSDQIISLLGVPNGLPSGYVDRKKFGSQTVRYNPYPSWSNLVDQQLGGVSPVNITLKDSLSGKELIVIMRLDYTAAVTGTHKYSLYVTESKIVSKQTTLTSYDDNYQHNHALRYAFGSAVGNPIGVSLVPGRVFIREYRYIMPDNWVADNCHIVCVVSDAATEEVVNVREVHLK